MTSRALIAAIAATLLAGAVLSTLVGLVYDWHGAATTAEILLPLGAATTLAACWLLRRRELLGGLRRQFVLGAGVALAPLVLGTALFTALMANGPLDLSSPQMPLLKRQQSMRSPDIPLDRHRR